MSEREPGLDPAEVRRIARLARLELGEDEVARLAVEMGGILRRFRELEAAEEGRGPPVAHGELLGRGIEPRLRPDLPGSDPLAFPPSENAPDWRDGLFVVPGLPILSSPAGEVSETPAEDAGAR